MKTFDKIRGEFAFARLADRLQCKQPEFLSEHFARDVVLIKKIREDARFFHVTSTWLGMKYFDIKYLLLLLTLENFPSK